MQGHLQITQTQNKQCSTYLQAVRVYTASLPGTENLQKVAGGETEQTELVMRVLSATVIYKKEWQCQFYQVCKMKKPQSLGLV